MEILYLDLKEGSQGDITIFQTKKLDQSGDEGGGDQKYFDRRLDLVQDFVKKTRKLTMTPKIGAQFRNI